MKIKLSIIFSIIFAFLLFPTFLHADNIDSTYKYSWEENPGWDNWKPSYGGTDYGVTVYNECLTGYLWNENVGWIKVGDSSCAGGDCCQIGTTKGYENDSNSTDNDGDGIADDWGVNNDGSGNLSGYGWGENVGWINFKDTSANNYNQVVIDSNGYFTNYAWGENVGWIHLEDTSGNNYFKLKTSWTPSAGVLSLSAPASVTFSSYQLGGAGYSEYTFATGTEQIIAADSGIGSGWTLAGTCTDWTNSGKTISKGLFYFRSDGATNTEPSLIFSNNSYTGIAEGTDSQNFNSSVTLMTASNGNGIGTYYFQPTFDLYISSTSTYAGTYTATMTLTLAKRDNNSPPLFKTLWQRLRDFSTLGRNAKFFNEEYSFNKLARLTDYNLPKLLLANSKGWRG